MPDVTVKSIDDLEAIYGGLARRARARLTSTLPLPSLSRRPNEAARGEKRRARR
jgi:hypothetical protein